MNSHDDDVDPDATQEINIGQFKDTELEDEKTPYFMEPGFVDEVKNMEDGIYKRHCKALLKLAEDIRREEAEQEGKKVINYYHLKINV